MRLFHRTTAAAAAAILAGGFEDGTGYYMMPALRAGVWLSDVPRDAAEGAEGDTLLEVVLAVDPTPYEWVQEPSFGYREFLIPAAVVNATARVRAVDEDELDT